VRGLLSQLIVDDFTNTAAKKVVMQGSTMLREREHLQSCIRRSVIVVENNCQGSTMHGERTPVVTRPFFHSFDAVLVLSKTPAI
jgi:hypothetical protein